MCFRRFHLSAFCSQPQAFVLYRSFLHTVSRNRSRPFCIHCFELSCRVILTTDRNKRRSFSHGYFVSQPVLPRPLQFCTCASERAAFQLGPISSNRSLLSYPSLVEEKMIWVRGCLTPDYGDPTLRFWVSRKGVPSEGLGMGVGYVKSKDSRTPRTLFTVNPCFHRCILFHKLITRSSSSSSHAWCSINLIDRNGQ